MKTKIQPPVHWISALLLILLPRPPPPPLPPQRSTLTKQTSIHQAKVSSWLHSSVDMDKCCKGCCSSKSTHRL